VPLGLWLHKFFFFWVIYMCLENVLYLSKSEKRVDEIYIYIYMSVSTFYRLLCCPPTWQDFFPPQNYINFFPPLNLSLQNYWPLLMLYPSVWKLGFLMCTCFLFACKCCHFRSRKAFNALSLYLLACLRTLDFLDCRICTDPTWIICDYSLFQ
jgi:hypothetical protein